MPRVLICILCFLSVTSCEKNISFKPNDTPSKLVVEAFIENGRLPEVRLSTTLDYFSKLSPELLSSAFVRHAEVTMSNGTKTHRLREYKRPFMNGLYLYYYSIDTTQPATAFKGEEGKTYSLLIKTGGKEYTATTTIPFLTKKIDSLWWEPAPPNLHPNKVKLMSRMTDPPGLGNYIRYYIQLHNGAFYPAQNSVFDDQITDGKTYSVQLESGVNRADDIDQDDYGFFYRGDSITVKFTNIDKFTFDFWRTMEYNYASIGNPFSAPTKVLSNIKGEALGYFGGYAVQFKSLYVPY